MTNAEASDAVSKLRGANWFKVVSVIESLAMQMNVVMVEVDGLGRAAICFPFPAPAQPVADSEATDAVVTA